MAFRSLLRAVLSRRPRWGAPRTTQNRSVSRKQPPNEAIISLVLVLCAACSGPDWAHELHEVDGRRWSGRLELRLDSLGGRVKHVFLVVVLSLGQASLPTVPDLAWQMVATIDLNGDT